MQKLVLLTSSILTATLMLTACGSGGDSSSGSDKPSQPAKPPTPSVPPVDNKPVVVEKNTLSGVVMDANKLPIANATIILGKNTVVTNQTGNYKFSLENKMNTGALIIKKPGYSTLVKEVSFVPNQAYKLDIALAMDQISTAFETSGRVTESFNSQASIDFSSNSITDGKGQPYNGTANLAASYYGPNLIASTLIFTHPSSGQRLDGSSVTDLANVGTIEFKLTDTMGNELGIAKNKRATLIFSETSTDQNLQTIPLWYYDKTKALWVEEGVAERITGTDNNYEGSYAADVSRPGLWSVSIPLDQNSAMIEGCLVDDGSNKPVSQLELVIGGQGFETYSRPDNNGKFSIAVPIGTPTLLSSAKYQGNFKEVRIPALARNEVYNIDNGQCLVTSQNKVQGLIDLNAEKNAFLNQLITLPSIIKPTMTSASFKKPLTIAARKSINVVGYQFDLVDKSAVTDIILKDVESYTDPKNSKFDSTTYILQSLYTNNDEYIEDYKFWSKTIITPRELLASSAQGARYRGPYLENPSTMGPEIAAIIQYDTTFNNNQLTSNYYDQLLIVNSYRDQSLANQKISDILFYDAPKTPTNINIINSLNRLPTSLNSFDSAADCKILATRTTNVDYIEYVTVINSPKNDYNNIKPPLVNPIAGAWFQNNPIKWKAEKATNASGISRAIRLYDDGTYNEAIYVRANTLKTSPIEKQRCNIYNKAAKDQILEALSKVTLPSQ